MVIQSKSRLFLKWSELCDAFCRAEPGLGALGEGVVGKGAERAVRTQLTWEIWWRTRLPLKDVVCVCFPSLVIVLLSPCPAFLEENRQHTATAAFLPPLHLTSAERLQLKHASLGNTLSSCQLWEMPLIPGLDGRSVKEVRTLHLSKGLSLGWALPLNSWDPRWAFLASEFPYLLGLWWDYMK